MLVSVLVSARRVPGCRAALVQLDATGATGTSGVLLVRCANAVVRCVDWYMHYRPVAAGIAAVLDRSGSGIGTRHEVREGWSLATANEGPAWTAAIGATMLPGTRTGR